MDALANIAGGNVIVKSLAKTRFQSSDTFPGYQSNNVVVNGPTCWCPKESQKNPNQWLQLDLGEVKTIHGFETQGHSSHGGHWCETIRFDTSIDCKKWSREGIFQANKGTDDIKNNKLKEEKYARYVRFYPQKCGGGDGGWGKLRVEVFWTEALNYVPEQKLNERKVNERKENNINNNDNDNMKQDDSNLPEFPGIVVTMSTELVRLRGGPYWTESYALLRRSSRASSSRIEGKKDNIVKPTLCVVDHTTDGGRWILISTYSSECRNHDLSGASLPKRTIGNDVIGGSCIMTSVNQFGKFKLLL